MRHHWVEVIQEDQVLVMHRHWVEVVRAEEVLVFRVEEVLLFRVEKVLVRVEKVLVRVVVLPWAVVIQEELVLVTHRQREVHLFRGQSLLNRLEKRPQR